LIRSVNTFSTSDCAHRIELEYIRVVNCAAR